MNIVPLTQGQVTRVDDDDYALLSQHRWYARRRRNGTYYAVRRGKVGDGTSKNIYLHRFLLTPADDQEVDHINGDTLDNRRENLRACTRAQNARNLPKRKAGTSQWKGVRWRKESRKWEAKICVDRLQIYLGMFDNEVDAAVAYDEAARRYFGEFARPNF